MGLSRRQFVGHTVGAVASGLSIPTQTNTRFWPSASERFTNQAVQVDPDHVRILALRAVDAARSAGATYADVRLTRTVSQLYRGSLRLSSNVGDREDLAIGVRALVNGIWGFAASPYWELDETVQVAREAVRQATQQEADVAVKMSRRVELGSSPIATGTWVMPGIDPFSIPIEEKADFMDGWAQAVGDAPRANVNVGDVQTEMNFLRQERWLASTEGTYVAQTTYTTSGKFTIKLFSRDWRRGGEVDINASGLFVQGRGWDAILEAKLQDQVPKMLADGEAQFHTRSSPVQVGHYSLVLDAEAAAAVLAKTIGIATQLDRALGYEANAGGTSYLGPDPLALLGTYQAGSSLMNVTADRSMPGGAATVQWDDDGVHPEPFTLVRQGILVDYQTTREQAAWLAPWYQQRGMPVRSHGCAAAPSALAIAMEHTPNLRLTPSNDVVSFEDLVADTPKGIAFIGGDVQTDFQSRTGVGFGTTVREITNGTLGRTLGGAMYSFEATALWKNLIAVGGDTSVMPVSFLFGKGQPGQGMECTVMAPALKLANMSVLDATRRA